MSYVAFLSFTENNLFHDNLFSEAGFENVHVIRIYSPTNFCDLCLNVFD